MEVSCSSIDTPAEAAISFSALATPRRVAQHVHVLTRHDQRGVHQVVQGGGIADHGGLETEPLAHGENGHPVHRDLAADQHHVAGAGARGRNLHAGGDDTDPGRIDEDAVALAAVHHLGVAGDDGDFGRGRRAAHRFHHAAQVGERKPLLQDEARGEVERLGPAHGEVVHGAVHGQGADVAPGEKDGADHEGVVAEGDAPGRKGKDGAVVERREGLVAQRGEEHRLDELLREPPAAAVRELHGLVRLGRHRAGPLRRIGPRLVAHGCLR
jgi:hypothetical protein